MTKTYAEAFIWVSAPDCISKSTKQSTPLPPTVTIYRDKDLTDKIYSDSLIIDLRYDIPVKTEVTATKKAGITAM